MKAKFFILGLCSLALAACSLDEVSKVNDSNAIYFKATTTTRTTVTSTNNIESFSVWGWKTDGDGTVTETMIDGDTASKGSAGTYNTERTYYWPGCAMDFCAFIPAATEIEDGAVQLGNKMDFSGEVLEDGSAYDYTGYVATATVTSPDAMSVEMHVPADSGDEIDLCYAVTKGRSTGTVPLNFRHALSQIAFKAMNGNADWTVYIKDVSLCGIYKEGTYTLPVFETGEEGTTEQNSDTAKKGTWTVEENSPKGRFNAEINATTLKGLTSEAENITSGSLMLIPQTTGEWDVLTDPKNAELGAYIRINCRVIDEEEGQLWPNYNGTDSSVEPLEYAEITVPFDVDWKEGYKYTYTIVFGEGLGYYPPDDGNSGLEGTPVLIPIRFTVDTNDFDKADGGDVSTEPEPVPIDYFDYILDEAFLTYMQRFDRNGDGHLYYDELEYIEEIECNTAEDFTGIEYYYNLLKFTSNSAKCTSISFEEENEADVLDLSNNTNLEYVCFNTNHNVVSGEYSAPVKHIVLTGTNITEIGDYAFYYCTDLTTVELPDCLEVIGGHAFRYCTSLTSIILPENTTSIGNYAFSSSGLLSISIPDKVTSIGNNSFSQCAGLTSAELSSTLETIGTYAFWECTSLTSILIPASVESIGNDAFNTCMNLSAVTFSTPLSANMTIGTRAFLDCDNLEKITIPEGVVSIGEYAFQSCDYLTTVNLPSTLTTLGKYAFETCKYLTAIEIPGGVKELNGYTFREDYELESVTLNEGLESIGASDFYGCFGLESIVIPSTVTNIGNSAFNGCLNMVSMTVLATLPPTLGTNTFSGIKSSAVLYVPSESVSAYDTAGWGSYFKGGIQAIGN